MPRVKTNAITIEYECFGSKDAQAIVLISGLGMQMIRWPVPFCEMLASHGYHVIRFDNRDVGLSSWFNDALVPDLSILATALAKGERPSVPYTLYDMAKDTVALLDALAIEKAHIVGRSMGGMIAQLVASEHPHRALSLTSIMSSTGNPGLPPTSPEVMAILTQRAPHPLEDEKGFLAHAITLSRVIGSPGYPFDEEAQRAQILAEVHRAYNPAGFGRQIAAIALTGDLRARLNTIIAPTLVIHGAQDMLVSVAGGRDTAANIKGAALKIIEGMGHDFPPGLYTTITQAIAHNARREVGAKMETE